MEDKTLELNEALGVQVYSTKKIDMNTFPKGSPYVVEGAEEPDESEATRAELAEAGVVFYRDSLNSDGIVLSEKTGPMFYSQFYIGEDGTIGRVFHLNVSRTVVKMTPQAVTWK